MSWEVHKERSVKLTANCVLYILNVTIVEVKRAASRKEINVFLCISRFMLC